MNNSALRLQVEQSLAYRIPSALTVRPRSERARVACGIEPIDQLFRGGIPVGAISELVGPESSGRSTAAVSFIAKLTRTGTVSAWIDVADTFDPETAAANGVELERLLWVRCFHGSDASRVDGSKVRQNIRSTLTSHATPAAYHGGGSTHPRSEGRGMSGAIEQLLGPQPRSAALKPKRRDKSIGTPGAPNRSLTERVEQVSWDRLPPRRGDNAQPNLVARSTELLHGWKRDEVPSPDVVPVRAQRETGSWDAIAHALRATDLLLQGGGFSAIVLDLGSIPAEQAWKIPLSSWFRFRAACERSQAILLVLTQHPCARSSAELVVHMHGGEMQTDARVMTGVSYRAEIERQRFVRQENNMVPLHKPPQREQGAQWTGRAAWARGR